MLTGNMIRQLGDRQRSTIRDIELKGLIVDQRALERTLAQSFRSVGLNGPLFIPSNKNFHRRIK